MPKFQILLWIFLGLTMSYAFPQSGVASKQPDSMQRRIKFEISPAFLDSKLETDIKLNCSITNLMQKPFKLRKRWSFTREGNICGTLSCEIKLDGAPYLEWKKRAINIRYKDWTSEDVITLHKDESHAFQALLTDSYPLNQKGTYTLQATFEPAKLDGVKVSKCRPVKSNWVTIVVQ